MINRRELIVGASILALSSTVTFAQGKNAAEVAVEAAKKYAGTEISIVWEAGLQSLDPLNYSGPKWEQLTGIKVKVVEHLRKWLDDEVLGLWRTDDNGTPENFTDDKKVPVAPVDSDTLFVDDSPVYLSKAPVHQAGRHGPVAIEPGDRLLIEALIALPGRPIGGERQVRPDGTVSLGFYGDLKVAGLTLQETKVKVIEHLRRTDTLLSELRRVLEPGGLACISTNNLSSWHNVVSLTVGYQPMPMHVSDELIVGNPLNPERGVPHEPGRVHGGAVFEVHRTVIGLHGETLVRVEFRPTLF